MVSRVCASISIGGEVRADWIDPLCKAIEAEGVGPAWGEELPSRVALLEHLRTGADGADFCAFEVSGGEFDILQAFCVEHGLTYKLLYDGHGGEWGPAIELHHADGTEEQCSLNGDGGDPCVSGWEIDRHGFTSVEEIRTHLRRFETFRPGRLILADPIDALDLEGAP